MSSRAAIFSAGCNGGGSLRGLLGLRALGLLRSLDCDEAADIVVPCLRELVFLADVSHRRLLNVVIGGTTVAARPCSLAKELGVAAADAAVSTARRGNLGSLDHDVVPM